MRDSDEDRWVELDLAHVEWGTLGPSPVKQGVLVSVECHSLGLMLDGEGICLRLHSFADAANLTAALMGIALNLAKTEDELRQLDDIVSMRGAGNA